MLRQQIIEKLFTPSGLNKWFNRDEWQQKNGVVDLIDQIDKAIDRPISIRDKIYAIVLHDGIIPQCKACGNETQYFASLRQFAQYCCKACSDSNPNKAKMAREAIDPKLLQSKKIEKNGSLKTSQVSKYKKQQTLQRKYGVDNPYQIEHVRQKISEVQKHRTRLFDVGQHPAQKHFTEQMVIDSVNIKQLHQEYIDSGRAITVFSTSRGFSPSHLYNKFVLAGLEINKLPFISEPHRIVYQFIIDNYAGQVLVNDRKILDKGELDIVLPDLKIAIEIDGLFWHAENRVGVEYHLNKTKTAAAKGYRLYHLFDSEILNNLDLVKSMLGKWIGLPVTSIGARKLTADVVDRTTYRQFCQDNHLQGWKSAQIVIGLYDQDKLVSLMSFSRPQYNRHYQWEIVRYCTSRDMVVVGGATRLFNHFIKHYQPESIITYCDLRYSVGDVYSRLGMRFVRTTAPNYYYADMKRVVLHSRLKFQKHKLATLLPNYNPDLSEAQNMKNHRYERIYDCGNAVFEWKKAA